MPAPKKKPKRGVEKNYPTQQLVVKLRRLADCLERGKRFQIQVAGERISVPPGAVINIEYKRCDGEEEIEFQPKWSLDR